MRSNRHCRYGWHAINKQRREGNCRSDVYALGDGKALTSLTEAAVYITTRLVEANNNRMPCKEYGPFAFPSDPPHLSVHFRTSTPSGTFPPSVLTNTTCLFHIPTHHT